MTRLLTRALLVVLVVALWQWHGALAAEREAARHQRHRIGRLIDSEEREGHQVAAVSVARGGEQWLYGRTGGLWRNLDFHQAAARESDVISLVDSLLLGEGVVQSDDPTRFADYGIGTDDTWRVTLHGPDVVSDPDRDVWLEFEIGLPVEGLDGCFVKRGDRDVVWALDTDPHGLLDAAPAGQPPLLETTLLPSVWPGPRRGLRSVLVERSDGVRYGLDLRTVELTPQQLQQGVPPYTWVLQRPDGSEAETQPMLATAYSLHLRRAAWREVVAPERARELGLEQPAARLVIVPQPPPEGGDVQPLILLIGPPADDGRVPVLNSVTGNLLLVDAALVPLLAPQPELLLPGALSNPWDEAMRAAQAAAEAQGPGLPGGFSLPGR